VLRVLRIFTGVVSFLYLILVLNLVPTRKLPLVADLSASREAYQQLVCTLDMGALGTHGRAAEPHSGPRDRG
jgi:hypothetical protein